MAGQSFNPSSKTFLGSERAVARRLAKPLAQFLRIEAAGGILLILSAIVALVWVNSPFGDSYHRFWETPFDVRIGDFHLGSDEHPFTLELLVNDALIAIFFFVVGMEIKLERVVGQLRDSRVAALPALAALGGMVVPAGLFIVFNTASPEFDGWGIPMATDIAFALGVLSLLGSRVPSTLRVFLLTLAIVDDIGAILVIAVFYTTDLSTGWLLIAAILVILVVLLREVRVWYTPLYVVIGMVVWL
ncbi:MAG: Na+/H+ antiporter NhaA, partial [Acidimicrobiales bacterium]